MAAPAPPRALRGLFPTLHGYRIASLRTDVLAGLTAGAVVVPQAMAYATIADLPVQYGLYTCMLPMVVYAALGGSRALSMSTTSTIATLVATSLVGLSTVSGGGDSEARIRALATLTVLVGVMLLVARVLRLGSLVQNISHATLTGIKASVGLTVAVGQVPKLLGARETLHGHGFVPELRAAFRAFSDVNGTTVLLSVVSLAALVLVSRVWPRLPAPLIVVTGGILAATFGGITDRGVSLVSPIPAGLPTIVLPRLGDVPHLLPAAAAIAIMAFLESVAVAREVRNRKDPRIDPDQELLAVGAASLVGGFTAVIPAAGGFSQSAVAQRAGARSQVVSVVTALLAVLVAIFLAPVLDHMPEATLGAVVLVATLGLVDVREFRALTRFDMSELWIAVATTLVGLLSGLLAGVAAGVLMTLFIVLRDLDRPQVEVLRHGPGGWEPSPDEPLQHDAPTAGGISHAAGTTDPTSDPGPTDTSPLSDSSLLVLRLRGMLYTANVRPTVERTAQLVRAASARTVVLEVSAMDWVSSTVVDELEDLDDELAENGCRLFLTGVAPALEPRLRASDWFRELEAQGRVVSTIDAVEVAGRAPHPPETTTPGRATSSGADVPPDGPGTPSASAPS
ncbi:SulP family inorganic anion transporter [Oerskovia sp. Root918]|uniref:SulP family inorganic anion transporter n=1 Tax=Oerskovia sp. Root918 TaxID=1736607 RepID=UPI0009EBD6B4|nr:SulP family inorganic anion transporter [Oerskovia sp. Root918]